MVLEFQKLQFSYWEFFKIRGRIPNIYVHMQTRRILCLLSCLTNIIKGVTSLFKCTFRIIFAGSYETQINFSTKMRLTLYNFTQHLYHNLPNVSGRITTYSMRSNKRSVRPLDRLQYIDFMGCSFYFYVCIHVCRIKLIGKKNDP